MVFAKKQGYLIPVIILSVLLMLLISGCRPSVKQKTEMEEAKQRAANAIEGAKVEKAAAEAKAASQDVAELAGKVKSTTVKDTWSEPLKKAQELLAQAQQKLGEGTAAQQKASPGTVPKVVATYKEAEVLAQQSMEQARLAKSRAEAETRRLSEVYKKEVAEEKDRQEKAARIKALTDEVKRLQDLLEKAIKSGDPFEIARLMVALADAELKLEKERLAQDLTDKAAVSQAEKRLADMRDLENRLKKAKADMEAARQKYEEAKTKRESLEKKVEALKKEVAGIRNEINEASQQKNALEEEMNRQ